MLNPNSEAHYNEANKSLLYNIDETVLFSAFFA